MVLVRLGASAALLEGRVLVTSPTMTLDLVRADGPTTGLRKTCLPSLTVCHERLRAEAIVPLTMRSGMMGEQSNGNPFCGRMAMIKVPGKAPVKAKLVDKCMGCVSAILTSTFTTNYIVLTGVDRRDNLLIYPPTSSTSYMIGRRAVATMWSGISPPKRTKNIGILPIATHRRCWI